jgi:hypothetical protein
MLSLRLLEQKWKFGHQTGKFSVNKGVLHVTSYFPLTPRRTSHCFEEAAH